MFHWKCFTVTNLITKAMKSTTDELKCTVVSHKQFK